MIFSATPLRAQDYFNPYALTLNGSMPKAADLANFSQSQGQLPGIYRVDIYVNGNKKETRNVNFVNSSSGLQPELTARQLADFGVKRAAFPALQALPDDKPISSIGQYIPDASTKLNFHQLRLDISIPQAAMDNQARGYIDPARWDQGLPALLLSYAYSGSNTWQNNGSDNTNSNFLNLRSGANLGGWRIRNYSTYSDSQPGIYHWDNISTFIQHDVQALKGQFTAGGRLHTWGRTR